MSAPPASASPAPPSIGSKIPNASSLKYRNYTKEEVKAHSKSKDVWLIIHGKVYDVSHFMDDHPGGPEIMQQHGGEDATNEFEEVFHSETARRQLSDFLVGGLEGYTGDPNAHMKALSKGKSSTSTATKPSTSGGGSSSTVVVALAVVALAAAAYFLLN